jgi:hypothetical protein
MRKMVVDASVRALVYFAVFATAYFLAPVPILLTAVLVFRRLRVGDGINITGADDL